MFSWFSSPPAVNPESITSIPPTRNFSVVPQPTIRWDDLQSVGVYSAEQILKFAYPVVIFRAKWKVNIHRSEDVVVKALFSPASHPEYLKVFHEEFNILKFVNDSRVANSVNLFGWIGEGLLSGELRKQYQARMPEINASPAVGFVLNYYDNSLDQLIHTKLSVLTEANKIQILVDLAKGLVDLHSIGIVHGDLKPTNIFVKNKNPYEVVLGDFGLSSVVKSNDLRNIGASTVKAANQFVGTPRYAAPEMHGVVEGKYVGKVAASRSTDIYAFGILAWELLAGKIPFEEYPNETALLFALQSNARPDLSFLPSTSSYREVIKNLIASCWDNQRQKRLSAIDVYSILSGIQQQLISRQFNLFFSHKWEDKPFLRMIHMSLIRQGFRVWIDEEQMQHHLKASMRQGINNSDVFLVCLNQKYQESEMCCYELNEAIQQQKSIVVIVLQKNLWNWIHSDMKEKCRLNSHLFIDLSEYYEQFNQTTSIEQKNHFLQSLVLPQQQQQQNGFQKQFQKLVEILREKTTPMNGVQVLPIDPEAPPSSSSSSSSSARMTASTTPATAASTSKLGSSTSPTTAASSLDSFREKVDSLKSSPSLHSFREKVDSLKSSPSLDSFREKVDSLKSSPSLHAFREKVDSLKSSLPSSSSPMKSQFSTTPPPPPPPPAPSKPPSSSSSSSSLVSPKEATKPSESSFDSSKIYDGMKFVAVVACCLWVLSYVASFIFASWFRIIMTTLIVLGIAASFMKPNEPKKGGESKGILEGIFEFIVKIVLFAGIIGVVQVIEFFCNPRRYNRSHW